MFFFCCIILIYCHAYLLTYLHIVACPDKTRSRATYIIAQPVFSTMLANLSPAITLSLNKRSRDLLGIGSSTESPLHVRVRRSWPDRFTEGAGTSTSPTRALPSCKRKLFAEEIDSKDPSQHDAKDGMEINEDMEFSSLQNVDLHGVALEHLSEPESDPEKEPFESEPEEEPVEFESEEEESDPEEEPFEAEIEEVYDEEENPDAYLIPITPTRRELRARIDMSDNSSPMIACRYSYYLRIQEGGGRARIVTSRYLFAEDTIDPYNPYLCHPSDVIIERHPITGRIIVLLDYLAYARRMWGRLLR